MTKKLEPAADRCARYIVKCLVSGVPVVAVRQFRPVDFRMAMRRLRYSGVIKGHPPNLTLGRCALPYIERLTKV